MVNARSAPPVPLLELASEDGTPVYRLHGAWRLAHLEAAGAALPSSPPAAACIVDGSALESIDTAGGFLLWRHLAGRAQGTSGITLRAMAPPHARLLRLVNDATTLRFDVLAENDVRGVERGQCDAIILGHYAGITRCIGSQDRRQPVARFGLAHWPRLLKRRNLLPAGVPRRRATSNRTLDIPAMLEWIQFRCL